MTSPQIAIWIPQLVPDGAFDPCRAPPVPEPRRGARLRWRLDDRAGHRHCTEPGFQRSPRIRGRVHRTNPARLRGVRQYRGESIAPGEDHRQLGPTEPWATRGRPRHRRPIPALRCVRDRRRRLCLAVHRGRAVHAGGLDPGPDQLRGPILAGEGPCDGTEAVPETASAAVVRWWPPRFATPGGAPRRWLHRSRLDCNGRLYRGGLVVSSVGPLCGWLAARQVVSAKSVLPRGWVPVALTR